jgi:DNA repair protein RadC
MYRVNTFKIQLIRDGSIPVEDRPFIECSEDAYKIMQAIPEIKYADREHFVVLYMNTKHRVLWADVPFHGTINTASIFPREILKAALLCGCSAIVVGHNHPSGDPVPSQEDIRLTKDLADACKLLEVQLLDHIVMGDGTTQYLSMKDKGMF